MSGGWAISVEQTLSFLAACGIPPPTPTWGNMVDGRTYWASWMEFLFPGIATRGILSLASWGTASGIFSTRSWADI